MKGNQIAPTLAIIGKPNSGKSSLISALTLSDDIEVSSEVGTTTKNKKFQYTYKDKVICNYYDTPGFEDAKIILEHYEKSNAYGTKIDEFIEKYKNDESMAKDVEIIKAIQDSDYLLFVIDISEKFNPNTIGYDLEVIITMINKPTLVLFNNKSKDNKNKDEWKKALLDAGLSSTHDINPLDSSFISFKKLYGKLNDLFSKNDTRLNSIMSIYVEQHKDNIYRSSKKIVDAIAEILTLEKICKIKNKEATSKDKNDARDKYNKVINEIEKKYKKDIEKIWGYANIKVEDHTEDIGSKASMSIGFTSDERALMVALVGAGVGAGVGSFIPILGSIIGAIAGGAAGAAGSYLKDFSSIEMITGKNEITFRIDESDYEISIILIKRLLEHSYRIITQGHANRENIVIPPISDNWKFGKHYTLTKDKKIANIHKNIVIGKEVFDNREDLSKIILKEITKTLKNTKEDRRQDNIIEMQIQVQNILEKELKELKTDEKRQEFLITILTVSIACADCDGQIHNDEIEAINEFKTILLSSGLNVDKGKLESFIYDLIKNPPSPTVAFSMIKKLNFNNFDIFDIIINAIVVADGITSPEEIEFMNLWKKKKKLM